MPARYATVPNGGRMIVVSNLTSAEAANAAMNALIAHLRSKNQSLSSRYPLDLRPACLKSPCYLLVSRQAGLFS